MRKLPAIVILAILLVNTTGFYVYYVVQLSHIRLEMRQALKHMPEDQLEVLRFSPKGFKEALVDQHEIKVYGKMYDIVRITMTGDSIVVYALHDEKEDHLLALLDEIFSKPLRKDRPVPSSVIQFITLSFIIPVEKFAFEKSILKTNCYSAYFFSEITFWSENPEPPPWFRLH